ncbi:Hsp20/alpha crystallin family protein [Pigmentiphaga litoralis]|uniref:Hsp20/alpha crystallin family protein n=1 Tax=Pigmentiphaga litoralis TaxID=516702 RepID=UPI003B42CD40
MRSRDLGSWMWGDALSLLEQADRLHRQFFQNGAAEGRCWEPPVDVVETASEVLIHIALPGVPASGIVVGFDPDGITVSGVRRFPAPRSARIHRIEIPYGRFERRIALPLHALNPSPPEWADGCLLLTLTKVKVNP